MADICVPPDCLNGYDCYWLFFVSIQVLLTKTTMTLSTTYCYMLWYILWYILLYSYYCYISLCICIISGIGFPVYVNPFYHLRKWVNYCLLWYILLYIVILLYYCYISLYILYLIIETLFTPPSLLSYFWMNSRAYKLS